MDTKELKTAFEVAKLIGWEQGFNDAKAIYGKELKHQSHTADDIVDVGDEDHHDFICTACEEKI